MYKLTGAKLMPDEITNDPRVYFAAERTFLAWIRTGLALMGFGFVVARFGLFLRELQLEQSGVPMKSHLFSLWFGTALIAVGVVVNVISTWKHVRMVHDLDSGGRSFKKPSSLAITVSLILAAVGLAMAIYLVAAWGR
jgi:putative membrane protein